MRYLTLIRHAKSSWADPEITDFERPLNPRGRRDAPIMALRIADISGLPDLWISSPATRAAMTARMFADALQQSADAITLLPPLYEASLDTLITAVRQLPETANRVWLFGHNPGLTVLGQWLAMAAPAHLPTCAAVQVALPVDRWQDCQRAAATLEWWRSPRHPEPD